MTTKAYIGTADSLFAGRAYDSALYALQLMKGRPVSLLTKVDMGTPKVAVADAMIKAATSTNLPNATTKTYTAGDGTSAPLDSTDLPATTTISCADGAAVTVWPLDVPRNITFAASHNSSMVAMTITITGYDYYRQKQVKTLTVDAGGTTDSDATAATFAYIRSIAIYSAGDARTNTLNVGFGDVLGLPYYLEEKADLLHAFFDDAVDTIDAVVKGATATVSATTGDVRGTINFNGTLNGAKKCKVYMHISDANAASARGLLGKVPYSG